MAHRDDFVAQLAPVDILVPRYDAGRKRPVAKPSFLRSAVTIVGIRTAVARFLPVSHEGHSIETYVDTLHVRGMKRAEFITRKQKGIERRAHMSLFRELVEIEAGEKWNDYFKKHFGSACIIPNHLCVACWNCSLFGGMEAGTVGTFTRIHYFDTYSIEDSATCIASAQGSEEGVGIGNQVYEDLGEERDAATYHVYEYVKAGTTFPFLITIENPTLLDVAGYLQTLVRADTHGYGKYSANHGKFSTRVLAVATGYPRFSVLDMLDWAKEGEGALERRFEEQVVRFDSLQGSVTLFGDEHEPLKEGLRPAFRQYVQALAQ